MNPTVSVSNRSGKLPLGRLSFLSCVLLLVISHKRPIHMRDNCQEKEGGSAFFVCFQGPTFLGKRIYHGMASHFTWW